MRVIIPTHVEQELFDIVLHVSKDNPTAADRLASALEARCLSLADNPDRGSIMTVRGGVDIRRLVEGRYLIVYSVSSDAVRILRIIHGARRPRLLLKDLAPF